MTRRIHNFSAGPGALPLPVLESAQRDLVDFQGEGLSIMEMSHRGAVVDSMHNRCIADLRELLAIPDGYRVLFLGGGARTLFASLTMNLRVDGQPAWYVNTGNWANNALKEAAKLTDARELWSSAASNHDHVPAAGELKIPTEGAYLHYTSNNTIYGTEFHHVPDAGALPLLCDMSSDILSRPVDVSKFGMIYAGAQKNMGPAGVTVAIVREDLLARSTDRLPETLNFAKLAGKNSMLNTPPVFPIYMVGLVARYLLDQGGLDAMDAINQQKADLLYSAIENSDGFFKAHARPGSRSRMNVAFTSPDADTDKLFVAEALDVELSGLKGHRNVGGLRASIYNAVPLASVQALVDFMADFQRRRG